MVHFHPDKAQMPLFFALRLSKKGEAETNVGLITLMSHMTEEKMMAAEKILNPKISRHMLTRQPQSFLKNLKGITKEKPHFLLFRTIKKLSALLLYS